MIRMSTDLCVPVCSSARITALVNYMSKLPDKFCVHKETLKTKPERLDCLPSNFEYAQQAHGAENTESERRVGIKYRPYDFEQASTDYLQTTSIAEHHCYGLERESMKSVKATRETSHVDQSIGGVEKN